MKFSLIMCTINRVNEVQRFFQSISKQTYNDFELIVVDQNKDDRLKGLIDTYKNLINLKYIKSVEQGLSKNRNIGLKYVTGDIIAYPDDDCVYPRHTLERIHEIFIDKNVDSITIQFTELVNDGQNQIELNDFDSSIIRNAKPINKYNCLRRTCSITIFINKNVHEFIGGFNENIGLGGTLIQAGEDHDYAFNILKNGYHMVYLPQIAVLHPVPKINLLHKEQYDKNKNRIELTGKVNMFMANTHKLGIDFKFYRLFDRLAGFVYRAMKLDVKRCKLIYWDIRSMVKYWGLN
ncbi:glycosyltransferase family 2 protein [Candidatus Pristimantibacillus sp. PTI5]|uniref:glycosyltransferase family 2 protein n=1 Tax=Candidatus Pristimantibacillus sp. PTI5 TaxID=3400422 RepID=UPI003B01D241